jgi:hypothetical protein
LASQHASERFVRIKRCGCWGIPPKLIVFVSLKSENLIAASLKLAVEVKGRILQVEHNLSNPFHGLEFKFWGCKHLSFWQIALTLYLFLQHASDCSSEIPYL